VAYPARADQSRAQAVSGRPGVLSTRRLEPERAIAQPCPRRLAAARVRGTPRETLHASFAVWHSTRWGQDGRTHACS
jgi:hypothetical protein